MMNHYIRKRLLAVYWYDSIKSLGSSGLQRLGVLLLLMRWDACPGPNSSPVVIIFLSLGKKYSYFLTQEHVTRGHTDYAKLNHH